MKTKISFLTIIFISLFAVFANAQGPEFITVWKTDNTGSFTPLTNTQILFPGLGTNYTIQWEEQGNPANNGTLTGNDATLIEFGAVGTYIVKVTPGTGSFTGVLSNNESPSKLTGLTQWGTAVVWKSLENGFRNCTNLNITATDIPAFDPLLTSLRGLFLNCSSLVWNPSVNNWDVSSISNMADMFAGASLFNQSLNNWNVRNVTSMEEMFADAKSFNQPLENWNVGNVINMTEMFSGAQSFNQPLQNWDVSEVTNMSYMFSDAESFNQPLDNWDVSRVISAGSMFEDALVFNQPLGNWDISSMEDLAELFDESPSIDCINYSKTLIGWANNPNTPDNMELYSQLFYGNNGAIARDALIAKGWIIDGDTFDPACDAALPVGFGNISAILRGSTLWVNWTTLSETNNSYFNIEISKDGKNFTTIGEMKSKAVGGNSSNVLDYSFTKNAADAAKLGGWLLLPLALGLLVTNKKRTKAAGRLIAVLGVALLGLSACSKSDGVNKDIEEGSLYIRIKQIDKDGGFEYSKIVKAKPKQ